MDQNNEINNEINNETIAIFSSHYSVGRSILTLDEAEEIKENTPVSICSIAQKYNLKKILLIDSSFSGFQEAYRNLTAINVQLIYGIKLHICDNVEDKSEKGAVNDNKIYLIAKNKDGYKELIKIYSKAATNGFYYYPRLDWAQLNKITDNIAVWVPFYDGLVHCNLLSYGVSIIPQFKNVKSLFCIENHDLPFDELIEGGVKNYCAENGYKMQKTHQIYYYKNSDVKNYQTFRSINNRSTLSKPNLSHFSNSSFSFESWNK